MKYWLRGKRGWLAAFAAIAVLVIGGLGWITAAVLRLDAERIEARANEQAQTERGDLLRQALWSLDSQISHVLGREESRPYSHYSAVYALSLALQNDGALCAPGTVLEPSPLLNNDLPDWMLLHFQVDRVSGWASPQVLTDSLRKSLTKVNERTPLSNVTPQRQQLLIELARQLPPAELMANAHLTRAELIHRDTVMSLSKQVEELNFDAQGRNNPEQKPMDVNPQKQQAQGIDDYVKRGGINYRMKQDTASKEQLDDASVVLNNTFQNGQGWFIRNQKQDRAGARSSIRLSPLVPLWLKTEDEEKLVVARLVHIDDKEVCQGILLDWPRLKQFLADEVSQSFPEVEIEPVRESPPPHPERTMTALPVQLNPGPLDVPVPETGWSPLRLGLATTWIAALVALGAVGLGGWSLIDLSDRRIRFVSAVTHELRTPLTTLRLYLDMLTGGLVREEAQKAEYLQTLNNEAERLNRLVGNVLDFSRLENQKPDLEMSLVNVAEMLEQVRSTWQGRCQDAGKELVIENELKSEAVVHTNDRLLQQVLANLIDNACKYSRTAEDRRIWLRARADGSKSLVLEVEDRGPGVAAREARSIFRPFRRGSDADVTAGGVGLGLALAHRWAALLGGRLTLESAQNGACFRLRLPY